MQSCILWLARVTILLLTAACPGSAVEHCFFSLVTCRSYCCSRGGSPFLDFCCSDCSLSVNAATRNSFWCSGSLSPMGMLSAVTAALILLSIIVGLIVCLCCGCICSNVTGRQNPWQRRRTAPPHVTRSSSTIVTSVDCATADLPPSYDSLPPPAPCAPPSYDAVRENGSPAASEPPPAYCEQPSHAAPSQPPAYTADPPP